METKVRFFFRLAISNCITFVSKKFSVYKYKNKKAILDGKSYEIFWVTDFAQHIMNRKEHPSHLINLMEVES